MSDLGGQPTFVKNQREGFSLPHPPRIEFINIIDDNEFEEIRAKISQYVTETSIILIIASVSIIISIICLTPT